MGYFSVFGARTMVAVAALGILALLAPLSTAGAQPSVPAEPVDVTATPGNAQITLAWTPGDDGGSTIIRYEYTYDENGVPVNVWYPVPDSNRHTTGYTVTGLTNGTAYRFHLRAVNLEGNGAVAAAVSLPTVPATTPYPVSELVAAPGNSQATLTWIPGSDGGSPILYYEIRQRTGNGSYGPWTIMVGSSATTTSHIVTGLTNGVTYRFQVRAVNAIGPTPLPTPPDPEPKVEEPEPADPVPEVEEPEPADPVPEVEEPEPADPEPEVEEPEPADPEPADPQPEVEDPEPADPEPADPEPADPEPEVEVPEPADPESEVEVPEPADPESEVEVPEPADPEPEVEEPEPADPESEVEVPEPADPEDTGLQDDTALVDPVAVPPAGSTFYSGNVITSPEFCTDFSLGGPLLYPHDADGDGIADVCSLPHTRREAIARQRAAIALANHHPHLYTTLVNAACAATEGTAPCGGETLSAAPPLPPAGSRFYSGEVITGPGFCANRSLGGPTTYPDDADGDGIADVCSLPHTRREAIARQQAGDTLAKTFPAQFQTWVRNSCRALATDDYGDNPADLAKDVCA